MPWIVADTEDNSRELLKAGKSGFDKRVTQIAALCSDGESFYNRGNVIQFLKWLRQKAPCKVYFHNLRYDLGNLFGKALDVPDVLLVGNRLIYARWKRVLFHDSFNIWPMSVQVLGTVVGLAKKDFNATDRSYVERDVEIVVKAIELAHEIAGEFEIESLPATIGSLAVKVWKFLGGESWFCDSAAAKLAYYGGRVELFRTSAIGPISYLDVNSLYPWAMTQAFPRALGAQKDLDCEGIALVELDVPKDSFIAPLPVKRDDGSIYYPVGKLKGVWTTHEIRTAIAAGTKVKRVFEVQGSQETDYPYRDFIHEFYHRRQQAKTPGEKTFYKLFLNNLYGQQAMSGIISRSILRDSDSTLVFGDGQPYGNKLLVKTRMPLPDHVNYLHASYVTSYARSKLYNALVAVPKDDLVYCDTDSVIHRGDPLLPISGELGQFKLEKTWQACQTFGPKCYRGDDEWKAKGVRKDLAQEFIEQGKVEYEIPFGLREAIIGYDKGNEKQLSVWHKIEKRRITHYDKKKLVDGQYFPLLQS